MTEETIRPERFLEIWKHLSPPGADPTQLPEYVGTGTDDSGEYLELSDGTKLRRSHRGGWYPPGWSKYNDPDRPGIAHVLADSPSDNW